VACGLLSCDTVWCYRWLPTLWRNVPEDGGDAFFQNVSNHLQNHMASQHSRSKSTVYSFGWIISREERDCLGDLDIDGKIILNGSKQMGCEVVNLIKWLRIGSSCQLL
jgi:hypothetical protein